MSNTNWLDETFDSLETIRIEICSLQVLAKAFSITGNERVSEELLVTCERLTKAHNEIRGGAIAASLSEQYEEGMKQVGITLSTFLNAAGRE